MKNQFKSDRTETTYKGVKSVPRLFLLTFIFLLMVVAIGVFIKLRSWNVTASSKSATPVMARPFPLAAAPTPTPGEGHGPINVVRFTLYDVGILPRERHVKNGNVTFAIEDVSGTNSTINIERETGNYSAPLVLLEQIEQTEKVGRVKKELTLTPGRYWISMTANPNNRALLIVEQ